MSAGSQLVHYYWVWLKEWTATGRYDLLEITLRQKPSLVSQVEEYGLVDVVRDSGEVGEGVVKNRGVSRTQVQVRSSKLLYASAY